MKKFYTFLSAVIMGAAVVSAALPGSFNRFAKPAKGLELMTIEKASELPVMKLSDNMVAKKAASHVAKIQITDPDEPVITGNYVVTSTSDEAGQEYESFTSNISKENGKLMLNNFIFGSDANPLEVKLTNELDSKGNKNYFMDIPGMSTLLTYGGKEYKMFLYGPYGAGGKVGIFSNDISFYISPEDHNLYADYPDMGIVVCSLTPDNKIGQIVAVIQNITLCAPNATFSGDYYEYNSQTKEETLTPTTYDVYAEYYPEDKAVLMFNFMGTPKPAVFVVNEAEKMVMSDGLVLWTYTDYQSNPETPKSYDFSLITDFDNETPSTTSIFNIASSKDGKTVLSSAGAAFYCFEAQMPADIYFDITVELPFKITESDIDAAGVENVTVSDSNAPVEYFNLQGVRVANPSAGQIVIKRQGNTVSKQVIR